MKFDDIKWHDAVIKHIKIDRNNPGIIDTVIFEIIWTEQEDAFELIFEDVYWAKMNLNFGIVADENILNAVEHDRNDEDLTNFYSKWRGMMDDLLLGIYEIFLNSSGGNIKIISKKFEIKKLK